MIAKLLISHSVERRKEEISKLLAFHLVGRLAHVPGGGTNHPDLLYLPYDSKLGVSEAKKIKNHYSLKPYSAQGRVVVLEGCESEQHFEARQNSLAGTHWIHREGKRKARIIDVYGCVEEAIYCFWCWNGTYSREVTFGCC